MSFAAGEYTKNNKLTSTPIFTFFCGAVAVWPCIYSRSDVSFTIVAMKNTKPTQLTIFDLSRAPKVLGDVICMTLVWQFFWPQSLIQPAIPI